MATPGLVGSIVVGVIAVVGVVAILIWLAKKGYFEPEINDESLDERESLSDSIGRQDFRIPYRRRVGSWSLPYKVFVGSLALLLFGFGVATYQVMKTGSPYQQFLTTEAGYVIVGVAGIAGGVRLRGWFDDQIGKLYITYERAGKENLIETIKYAKTRVRRRDGVVTVPEIAPRRLMGLFWRYRQVGEDRQLRGTDKPLDDVITHQIPDHGDELPDGEGFTVTTREEGTRVLEGATSTADYTYGSPHSLSKEKAVENREKLRRKDAELKSIRATNAELYSQLRRLRKRIENDEYLDREELLDDFERISDMLSTLNLNLNDRTQNGAGGGDSAGNGSGGAEEARAS